MQKISAIASGLAMVAVFVSSAAVFAAPVAGKAPVHAIFARPHLVTVNLRNDSVTPMTLVAGTNEIVLAPGKLTAVKFVVGEKIVARDATPNYPAGTLVAVVSVDLNNATVSFK